MVAARRMPSSRAPSQELAATEIPSSATAAAASSSLILVVSIRGLLPAENVFLDRVAEDQAAERSHEGDIRPRQMTEGQHEVSRDEERHEERRRAAVRNLQN